MSPFAYALRLIREKQFIRFLAVGLANTVFGYSCFALLSLMGTNDAAALGAATIAGTLFNFKTFGALVFSSNDNRLFFHFVTVYAILYAINLAALKALERFGIDHYIAFALLLFPIALLSFVLNRRFVYRSPALPPPHGALYGLLNDCRNETAIAAFNAYRITIEKTLPRLRTAYFQEAINSPAFLVAINPAHKDLVTRTKKISRSDDIKKFFAAMVSIKPYDLPADYIFRMMEQAEVLGPSYALPAYCYLFNVIHTYSEIGEADRHAHFMQAALQWFYDRQGKSPIPAQERISLFAKAYSGSFAPYNQMNLKSILTIERDLLTQYNSSLFTVAAYASPASYRPHAKIKIGMVRHNGKAEISFFQPLLNNMPQDRYEIHLMVFSSDGTQDLCAQYPLIHLHVLDHQKLDHSVKIARSIGLDILLNTSSLSGDFLNAVAALLSYRIAPKQIDYCGDITTSGIRAMDYFLLGDKFDPEDLQGELLETVLCCPGIGFFVPPPLPPADNDRTAKRQALGIAPDTILFASNAHLLKLTPDLVSVWLEILARMPQAKLLMMPFSSDYVSNRFGRTFLTMLRRLCVQYDISEDRIILSSARGRDAILADLQAADIYLDSFPYSGATSAAEALVLGLPIVTRTGPNMRARYGMAMLAELGLKDTITQDIEDYIAMAVKLAQSKELRQNLSRNTKAAVEKASFFDANIIANQLDTVFSKLMCNEIDAHVRN